MKRTHAKGKGRLSHPGKKNHGTEHAHHGHSPFFYAWELMTLSCVVLVGFAFLGHGFFHLDERGEHLLELAVEGAEVILVVEVALLLIIARNKIHFIRTKWPTIIAALPFGGGLRIFQGMKIFWHAIEKTKFGEFFKHPVSVSKRWVHKNLGLRV